MWDWQLAVQDQMVQVVVISDTFAEDFHNVLHLESEAKFVFPAAVGSFVDQFQPLPRLTKTILVQVPPRNWDKISFSA